MRTKIFTLCLGTVSALALTLGWNGGAAASAYIPHEIISMSSDGSVYLERRTVRDGDDNYTTSYQPIEENIMDSVKPLFLCIESWIILRVKDVIEITVTPNPLKVSEFADVTVKAINSD